MTRITRATVDLDAIRHNLAIARDCSGDARLMAVLKANGYGHGLLRAAEALRDADAFAVSCLAEAGPLRDAGYAHRIVLLEGFFDSDELVVFAHRRLDPVIHAPWQVEVLEQRRLSRALDVWLKVDSGMHRLGFAVNEVAEIHRRLSAAPSVANVRFLTHLACADDLDDPTTERQLRAMDQACVGLPGERSSANSAGTLGWPASRLQWVRPGMMLYGCSPFIDYRDRWGLRNALTLEARLIAVHHYQAGERVGYGGTYTCPEDMAIGVVSIGYGDGYPRQAPNGTPTLVKGVRAPLAGRVSMDMITVDLRDVPDPAVGDRVVLWGDEALPTEEVADYCDSIAYEILCQLTGRVEFRYVGVGYGG
ncbi:MAG TPA: alanine racemase [Gammaproteobacteria bacterium]|nr:alanine racemase [Gammaproteobacteria bacterium]